MTHQCINRFSNKCSFNFLIKKKKKEYKDLQKTLTQCNKKGNQTLVEPLGPLHLVHEQKEGGR